MKSRPKQICNKCGYIIQHPATKVCPRCKTKEYLSDVTRADVYR